MTETPEAEMFGLSSCEHLDRFVIRPVGCMDEDCNDIMWGESVIEFEFVHESGINPQMHARTRAHARARMHGVVRGLRHKCRRVHREAL